MGNNGLLRARTAILGLSRVIFLSVGLAFAAPLRRYHALEDGPEEVEDGALWVLYVASIVLVLSGGAFAGLTIALMGQDEIYLQVISLDAEEPQRKNAKRVHDLLKKGKHWVLVTLLLSNVIVNETLPVVLDRCFGGGVAAVVGSTILIGECPFRTSLASLVICLTRVAHDSDIRRDFTPIRVRSLWAPNRWLYV